MSAHEQAQWVELYAELEKPLYNVVYRVIWDAAESQDIVQEAFLKCWQRRGRIRPQTLSALLFRTVLNLAIGRYRRGKLWRFVGLASAETEMPHDRCCDATISRGVERAIRALPNRLRRVLLLTEIAGMTYAEAAVTLGIREGTVGSRRTRALAILRQQLVDEGGSK
jgi:RNA polymerase sigma-70 factor (ECF subfamily)